MSLLVRNQGHHCMKTFFNFSPFRIKVSVPRLALSLGQRVLGTCQYRRESLLRPSSTWPEPACPGSSSESSCPSSSGWKKMLDSAQASLRPRRHPHPRRLMCRRCSPCCCLPVCWWKKAPSYNKEVEEDSNFWLIESNLQHTTRQVYRRLNSINFTS